MSTTRYEVALPLVGRFLYYDPDISRLLLTCKLWREILFHHLHELNISKATASLTTSNRGSHVFHPSFNAIYILSLQGVTEEAVYTVLSKVPSIRELRLSEVQMKANTTATTSAIHLDEVMPSHLIKRLTIHLCPSPFFYLDLLRRCQDLQELTLLSCLYLTDNDVTLAQQCCVNLTKLTIHASFGLSKPRIFSQSDLKEESSRIVARLQLLSLSYCPNVYGLALPTDLTVSLKILDISFTHITNKALTEIIERCHHLEELIAVLCLQLKGNLMIQSNALKRLDLTNCQKMESLVLDTPHLIELKLEFCVSLQSVSFASSLLYLRELSFILLKNLKKIDWNHGQTATFPSYLTHPNLKCLNLCGCLKFGEIMSDIINEDREEALNRIKENMFLYPFFTRFLEKEEQSRVEVELIPLLNWLVEMVYCCPSLDWKDFFQLRIGSTRILGHVKVIQGVIERIVKSVRSYYE